MKRKKRTKEYGKVHYWLRKHYGLPALCEIDNCKKISSTFDWALKKGKKHEKKRENYLRLCRSCHLIYDWTEEKAKKLIEIAHTPQADENRAKWRRGKKRASWICKKISKGRKGMVFTEEHRNNLSTSHKGKKFSEETKKKMSIAHLKRKNNE